MSVSGLESHVRRFVDGRMTKEKGGPKAALSFARSPILRRAGNLEQSNYGFADVKHRPPEKVVRCQKWTRPADAFLSNSRGTP